MGRAAKFWCLGLLVSMGCSANAGVPTGSYGGGEFRTTDTAGTGATGVPSTGTSGSTSTGTGTAQPGTLTAGAWDDNRNYAWFTDFRTTFEATSDPSTPPFTTEERDAAHARFAERGAHETLDVALVIDTTGSMGDEITYLQTELSDIAGRVVAAHPDAQTRWALVVYKDEGDEYLTRSFDFDGDVATFRAHLDAESASGGGDYPEAAAQALQAATELAWRSDASTSRLAFWVADAPHHAEQRDVLVSAIRTASSLDVHVYPVASSGVDELTEYTMRSSAQLTGGRYLFLTNDSGIGGDHLEPTIPCYFVTRLNDAMLRMIDIELTGVYREPEAAQILRTGGDPASGICTLSTGDTLQIF